jgi:hypothetical protein
VSARERRVSPRKRSRQSAPFLFAVSFSKCLSSSACLEVRVQKCLSRGPDAIQAQIENPLAQNILSGDYGQGNVVRVDAEAGRLSFGKG